MDILSSAILGGIIYDSLKYGLYKFSGQLRTGLRKYALTEDEIKVIEDFTEQNTLDNKTSLEEINIMLEKSQEIKELLDLKNSGVTQINNIETNNGPIIGSNHAEIKIDIKK